MGRNKKFTEEELWDNTYKIIKNNGYIGFNISALAASLNVSRAAIYKKYSNKEELLMDFMINKLEYSISKLSNIDSNLNFNEQLNELIIKMFELKDLHQILGISEKIENISDTILEKKTRLNKMYTNLYDPLLIIVKTGKEEGIINKNINDYIIISFIFQLIDIPNHTNIPEKMFYSNIKHLILFGLTTKK